MRAKRTADSIENLKSKIENSAVDPVFTLADLATWSRPGTSLAVLGHPIKHSVSPPMHNAALAALARTDARFADWKYFRFEIHPDDLPRALELLHVKKFRGVNLTVPHKIIAFDRVAEVDAAARAVGAINTLLWTPRGWHGFNTDGYGLAAAVREMFGRELKGAHVLLLGAGGAARGAAIECLQRDCASLNISNRTPSAMDELCELLKHLGPASKHVPIYGTALLESPRYLPAGSLVINATSLGLRPDDPAPIDLVILPRPAAVFDMIYNPPQTALLRAAEKLGVPHANGLAMLVHQGAKSLEIWSDAPAAQTAATMAAAARVALGV